ncbi:FixH family protein [Mariprofundus ferrooxydans]|uniref:FixH family protein n=1 Tax=Mariprofundus ferrooxydans TaxID=314344 RepID=UPI00142FA4D3|nr:FixH family protein [Mariprofundus ferrooxydans]
MLSAQLKQDFRSPWLRGVLAIVGVTVLVNIGFIGYAFIFPPNLVVKDYYERGKNYFHDQHIRQEELPTAWRLQLMFPDPLSVNAPKLCRLYVMDHQGKPVRSGRVMLTAYRPNSSADDFKVALKLVDAGTFAAPVNFPLPGNWDVIARIDADGQHFDTAQRIFVQK